MASESKREARIRLRVPFHDLDPMQVVWHGNYLKYFDQARQALFDSCGVDLYRFVDEIGYLFPVVRTTVKHVRPLRLRDEFECRAVLVEARHKIVVDFELRLLPGGELCAKGRAEQVAVRMPGAELEMRIPEPVRRALEGGAG